jgi:formate dehydrogenase alpha subunit
MTTSPLSKQEMKQKTFTVTIDGVKIEVPAGTTVLEAARSADIYIPTLCYDPDLEPYGACCLCVVEIEGMRGLPTSCTTPVTDGMVVHTETELIRLSRTATMELIMANHHGDCLTCAKNQHCELQKIAAYLGIKEEHFDKLRKSEAILEIDDSNPAFIRDMNKCILCAKCVRTCHEITCVDAIGLAFRGNSATVSTFGDKPILDSRCESCGECVVRCPTGALVFRETRQVTREVKSTCPYCAVGCQIYLGVRGDEIVSVRGNEDGPSNEGRLCVKGRFGVVDFVNHETRLKVPLIKRNGKFEEATWEEALSLVVEKLKKYNSEEVGFVSSARSTNEANYVMQKLGRVAFGTNNIDHCARI